MLKVLIIFCLFMNFTYSEVNAGKCLIAENPADIFSCINLSPQIIIGVIQNGDIKGFCKTATSFIGCMGPYVKDCIGGQVAMGGLNEIQDLNSKCCLDKDRTQCVFDHPEQTGNCFAADNMVTLSNNEKKKIMDLELGDYVKSIDSTGNVIDSEIVAIMHKSNDATNFLNIESSNGDVISITPGHLINIKNKGFIKASNTKVGDIMSIYSEKSQSAIESEIIKITNEIKQGYIAPLTESGTILVNNVQASCYSEISNHWLAHIVMKPVTLWYKLSKYIGSNTSEKIENGMNSYAAVLQQFGLKFMPSIFA